MTCNQMNSRMADLLLDPAAIEVQQVDAAENTLLQTPFAPEWKHLAECKACRQELDELRATIARLDHWNAAEPNPYFLTRLNARLEEERQAAPAGWFERLRAHMLYGSQWTMRPLAAISMAVVLLVGGGTYLGINNWDSPAVQPQQAAVVHDLQTLDKNAQLLDQLESLSSQNDDEGTSD